MCGRLMCTGHADLLANHPHIQSCRCDGKTTNHEQGDSCPRGKKILQGGFRPAEQDIKSGNGKDHANRQQNGNHRAALFNRIGLARQLSRDRA